MKSLFKVLSLVALAVPMQHISADCDCAVTGQAFFNVNPLYQSASPERVSLWRGSEFMERENGRGGNIQLALIGNKSTGSHLQRYFTPFCKESLLVRENPTALDNTDLISENFNVVTVDGNFQSTISLKPHQSVFGIGLTYRQDLGSMFSCFENCERPWWLEISSPLVRVHNRVTLDEAVDSYGGGVATVAGLPAEQTLVGTMVEAFKQPDWLYGKIDTSNKMTKWGLADIEVKLGYEWVNSECCGLESYVGMLIPTGNTPKAEYIFEPMIGHNKHFGLMCGSSAYFKLYEGECWTFHAYLDMNTEYLFSRKERRSFDLNNKPWSRYMSVYASFEQAQQAEALARTNPQAGALLATPGINVFTQDLNVKPGLSHTLNWALAAQKNCFDAELGFNLFTRQGECVALKDPFPTVIALKSAVGSGETNPIRTINMDLNNESVVFGSANYDKTVIKESDLNLYSAAHPGFISYNMYGALGYRWEDRCYPMFIGAGAGYNFGRGNEVLHSWTLWGKFGFSF